MYKKQVQDMKKKENENQCLQDQVYDRRAQVIGKSFIAPNSDELQNVLYLVMNCNLQRMEL